MVQALKHTVLILYAEVMGYTMASIKALVNKYPVTVYLIGWDSKKLTPYQPVTTAGIEYRNRSEFPDHVSLLAFTKKVNPEVIFVSGWMDKGYGQVAKYFRSRNTKVVAFVDNQWRGSIKQKIGSMLSPFILHTRFSHFWISGTYQYIFAKKMGYRDQQVYWFFYSADTDFFHAVYRQRKKFMEENSYPKTITFLGRFSEVKNVVNLLKTFLELAPSIPEWKLSLIGNGPLRNKLLELAGDHPQVKIKDFIQPAMLPEVMIQTGIFCLPSKNEPWGVVIHEFASAGIPMIVSEVCGAATEFVENESNGFLINPTSQNELQNKIIKMTSLTPEQLMMMGEKSYILSKKVTPDKWAATAMQIINNSKPLSKNIGVIEAKTYCF